MISLSRPIIGVDSMAVVSPTAEERERLMPLLTLTSRKQQGKNFILRLYEENGELMRIPRGLLTTQIQRQRTWPHIDINGPEIPWPEIRLRPKQKILISKYLETRNTESPYGVIIKSPTGTGKTVMGIWLIRYFKYKTLVVVPTDRIFNQWIERLKTFSNLDENEIGIIRGPVCRIKDKKVVIGMIHTLCKDKWPNLHHEFGHVIFDEVHTLGAETFSTVAGLYDSAVRTGLSATPRRKDGMENVFHYHIGKVVKIQQDVIKPTIVVVNYYDPLTAHTGCVWKGNFLLARYLNRLAENTQRNTVIAKYIAKAFNANRHILVLSDRIEQLQEIKKIIIGAFSVSHDSIGLLTGSIKQTDKQVILATYGSAGLGLDIPRLSCLVFATPHTDIEQAIGRILREEGNKPIVVDVVDAASAIMQSYFKKRFNYYKLYAGDIVRRWEGKR